jgi:DNA topoisomerase II
MANSSARILSVADLFNGSVREYSVYANDRAIPSVMDGFKPSQRKAIFGTLKRHSSIPATGIKVSQLAAAVSEVAAYHHGEGSLEGTITKLAQNYPGSNNLNYLLPMGQFGSRLSETPASSRYIFTNLAACFRKIFKKEDDVILKHLEEDGDQIEPEFYLPILPSVLINGANGMGTGFATNIYPYNPLDLRDYVTAKLKNKKYDKPLIPWFRGFAGTVERDGVAITMKGNFRKLNTTTIVVDELPIGIYQDAYKAHLINLVDEGYIKDFENRSTKDKFEFELTVPRTSGYADDEELDRKLKMTARDKENLTVWLCNRKVKKFESPEALCDYFVTERLKFYEARRLKIIEVLSADLILLAEKVRFTELYLTGDNPLKFSKMKKAELIAFLKAEGFSHSEQLIDIRISSLTTDQIDSLLRQLETADAELTRYLESTNKSLYLEDLAALDLKKELAWPQVVEGAQSD